MALSDLALEEMTKPKNMRQPDEDFMGPPSPFAQAQDDIATIRADKVRSGVNKTIDFLGLDKISQNTADVLNPGSVYSMPGSTRGLSGLGSLQETDYSSMISPENATRIEETVKTELLRNPELSDQQKQESVSNLSSSNILEFMGAVFQEAANLPDEEVGLMPAEQEQEAEMYIDEILGTGAMDSVAPAGMNYGGPVKHYNMGGLASMGRMEDTELAHVAPGERIVPEWILGDKGEDMLDAAFIRSGLDPIEYTVGSGQGSINPMTGMPEYTSFFKRLLKKVKKVAPALGALVGFSYGGPMGAAIGKTIGGVVKTGDFDFQDALTDFGTGWSLGNLATGFGLQPGKSIFKMGDRGYTIKKGDTLSDIAKKYGITEQELIAANRGVLPAIGVELKIPGEGLWGNIASTSPHRAQAPGQYATQEGVGGFMQSAGARLSGDSNIDLVNQFKDLSGAQKLGVGALGLAALSQTGMFDKEQRGEIPENITQGMQGLENYVNEPLRAYNPQPVWGQNAPLINIPQTQSAVSPFMTTRAPSLSETLSDLSNNRIGLDFPSFNPG